MPLPPAVFRPLPLAIACLLALPALAKAQEAQPRPSTPEACTSVESDAARLICYDTVFGRAVQDTIQQADAAASVARQEIVQHNQPNENDTPRQRARRKLGALFGNDESYQEALANAGKGSLLDSRWELAKDSKLGLFQMRAYKPVYLLPAFWTSSANRSPQSPNPANTVTSPQPLDDIEAKFQLSFKTKALENLFGDNGDVWLGYTQSSHWQVYNSGNSRPFRETNYEPEAMLVFRNNYSIGGWKGRMASIGFNHQSNGRSDPLSRSWNRVIGGAGLDRDNWALMMRAWYRVPESSADDNPDIADYAGRGDAMLVYNKNGHEISLLGRHSLRSGDRSHGALQLDWGIPINRNLRGRVQVFHGYGESMIDYNHKATYIGVGISLLEWF